MDKVYHQCKWPSTSGITLLCRLKGVIIPILRWEISVILVSLTRSDFLFCCENDSVWIFRRRWVYTEQWRYLLFCIPHHICRAVCLELQPRPDSDYFCDSHDNSCHGMVPGSCSGFISIICILAIKHFASGIHW